MRIASMLFCLILSIAILTGHAISDDDLNADYYFTRGGYYNEQGNYSEAAKRYRKAAGLGHAGAQSTLGVFCFKG